MRLSQYFFSTLKEVPKDAEIASHQLMLRAGFIQQLSSGIYSYLPLGLKVLQKFQEILRQELNSAGAIEVLFPSVIPEELWQESERWDAYGDQLLKMTDRLGRQYCFGPTHEEVVTEMAKQFIHSYKQLPLNVYQIQTKFRDELRPRFGLMRGREFCMKDAYSFHDSESSLDETYQVMKTAYYNIFESCGLEVQAVEADSGDIGGSESAEFMITAETGEDAIMKCSESGHAVNVEAAKTMPFKANEFRDQVSIEHVSTPSMKRIEEVVNGLNCSSSDLLKSLLVEVDNELVLVLIRGDHELNELKLKKQLNAFSINFVNDDDVFNTIGTVPGYVGPYQLSECRIVADHSLDPTYPYIVGGNQPDTHLRNVQLKYDVTVESYLDLRNASAGELTPWGGVYEEVRGIEVGHIFKLGTKYSESMKASFMNKEGRPSPFIMGCYGIGVGRTVAAAIEQNSDDKGMVWPKSLSPFDIQLICVNPKKEILTNACDSLYTNLKNTGLDILYDDRLDSPGKKFQDADLIGIPLQVIVGKSFEKSSEIEVKFRSSGDRLSLPYDRCVETIKELFDGC